jgi:hypothetical protein
VPAAAVDAWLAELGLPPVARVEREGLTAWDLLLDGRRRFDLRITVICGPRIGLIVWVPFAPPVKDDARRTYQQLLRWNDELPFVKFGLDSELRPVLTVEMPAEAADAWSLGLAIARVLAVCDYLLDTAAPWLAPGGLRAAPGPRRASRGESLLRRYAAELAELAGGPATLGADDRAGGPEVIGNERAGES